MGDLFSSPAASLPPPTHTATIINKAGFFFDPAECSGEQLAFLTLVYGYVLYQASEWISEGSELLLLVPKLGELVGTVLLPVLAAVPDGLMILFSGLGPNAERTVDVGVGTLAGSTVMLLTVPWFLSVLGGSVPLSADGKKALYNVCESLQEEERLSADNQDRDHGHARDRMSVVFFRSKRALVWLQRESQRLLNRRGGRVSRVIQRNAYFILGTASVYAWLLLGALLRNHEASEEEGATAPPTPPSDINESRSRRALPGVFSGTGGLVCAGWFAYYIYTQVRHSTPAAEEKVIDKIVAAIRCGDLTIRGALSDLNLGGDYYVVNAGADVADIASANCNYEREKSDAPMEGDESRSRGGRSCDLQAPLLLHASPGPTNSVSNSLLTTPPKAQTNPAPSLELTGNVKSKAPTPAKEPTCGKSKTQKSRASSPLPQPTAAATSPDTGVEALDYKPPTITIRPRTTTLQLDHERRKRRACKILAPFFRFYDINSDNQIDFEEFRMLLRDLDPTLYTQRPRAFHKELFDESDLDGNGVIDFGEFVQCMLRFAHDSGRDYSDSEKYGYLRNLHCRPSIRQYFSSRTSRARANDGDKSKELPRGGGRAPAGATTAAAADGAGGNSSLPENRFSRDAAAGLVTEEDVESLFGGGGGSPCSYTNSATASNYTHGVTRTLVFDEGFRTPLNGREGEGVAEVAKQKRPVLREEALRKLRESSGRDASYRRYSGSTASCHGRAGSAELDRQNGDSLVTATRTMRRGHAAGAPFPGEEAAVHGGKTSEADQVSVYFGLEEDDGAEDRFGTHPAAASDAIARRTERTFTFGDSGRTSEVLTLQGNTQTSTSRNDLDPDRSRSRDAVEDGLAPLPLADSNLHRQATAATGRPHSNHDGTSDGAGADTTANSTSQLRLVLRALATCGLGVFITILFSDPAVQVMAEIGRRFDISPFYVSFVLAPLASNASELVASYHYAQKKTSQSLTIALSTLEGAACMNNTFCLGVLLALMSWKNLGTWNRFVPQTAGILLVEGVVACVALRRKVHSVGCALGVLLLWPGALFVTWALEQAWGSGGTGEKI